MFRLSRLALMLTTLTALSFAAQAVKAETINFDGLAPGVDVPSAQYQAQGVLLNSTGLLGSIPSSVSPPYGLCGHFVGGCSEQIIINFVLPGTSTPGVVNSVSFFVIDLPGEPDEVGVYSASIFNSSGDLLNTQTGSATNVQLSFSAAGIHRVVFTASSDWEGIDDLSFNTPVIAKPAVAPVPEPATMLLLGTGLAGIGAAVKKKRRAGEGEES